MNATENATKLNMDDNYFHSIVNSHLKVAFSVAFITTGAAIPIASTTATNIPRIVLRCLGSGEGGE
jgi:hypothetical protein